MKNILFVTLITFCFLSCKEAPVQLNKIEAKQVKTDSLIHDNKEITDFITPFSDHLNKELDTPLSFTTGDLTKSDGRLESSMGNLMADISFELAHPLVLKKFEKNIDFVLLNHGGIRAPIAKGNISARNAFEVMPFENELVAVELTGEKTKDLIEYLAENKKAHPISNMILEIDEDDAEVESVLINAEAFDEEKNYIVLTTDYLQQGGDKMTFFADPVKLYPTDYKLRNALIDYFKKTDTIQPKLDKRFTYDD